TGAPASTPLGLGVTLTGDHVGTPAYMAPEQRGGGAVTAKADQYAFCVALHEALVGTRPVEGEPIAPEAPRFLRRLLARRLARDPDARHPSMDELLDDLARDPARTARRAALVIGVAAVVGALGWAAVARRGPSCSPSVATARLADAWSPARKDAVHAAFS